MFQRATLVGLAAILMWALLALLTASSGAVPPFQLTAMCFSIATILGFISIVIKGSGYVALRQPWPVWLLGVGGLFGYHFFYFTALRHAPAVEAGLIAYLWPLLIILFSALLPNEHLRLRHIIGGLLGFAGAFLIIGQKSSFGFNSDHMVGYAAAGLCALIWSSYSVLSRRFKEVPTDAVTGFCAVSALLAFMAHLGLETTHWPQTNTQWLAVLGLGLGPVGLAFYLWDFGVKNGNIQALGAASYAAPVLSTIVLVAAGFGAFSWTLVAATALVTLGAIVASQH